MTAVNLIPQVPLDTLMTKHPITGEYDIHPSWRSFFNQITNALQNNLSNQGHKLPPQSSDVINTLIQPQNTGLLVYDSTNHVLKTNLNSVIKTIATL